MWTDRDMVAYYLRKWDFDFKDSKWVFEMHFNEEHFEKRFLFLKKKDIICKEQYTRIKQRQPRRRQNFKVNFLQPTKPIWWEKPSGVFVGPQ